MSARLEHHHPSPWLPGRLWSLWGIMQRFQADEFYDAVSTLARARGLSADKQVKKNLIREHSENFETGKRVLLQLEESLRILGARVTRLGVRNLYERFIAEEEPITYAQFESSMTGLTSRLRDELSLVHLFVLEADKEKFYEPAEPLFGQNVSDAFPSASYEIEEAGKCLALRRSTACVAHLMRALEPALNSLATVFNVPFAYTNWHNILDQIESEIRQRSAGNQPPNWKVDGQFYSEAAAQFRFVKDAWRNHTMHLRDRYDEERAEVVFANVRSFMRLLATRLSEPPPAP